MLYNKYKVGKIDFEKKQVIDTITANVTASTKSTNNTVDALKENNLIVKSVDSVEFFVENRTEFENAIEKAVREKSGVKAEYIDGTVKHILSILASVGCLYPKTKK